MSNKDDLRALPAMNENYQPPRPWACITLHAHECDGHVVGAIGVTPVCQAGATVEVAARVADRERIARYIVEHADEIAAEARWEQAMERRYS